MLLSQVSHRYINIITYRSTPWNKILCKLFSWYDFSFSINFSGLLFNELVQGSIVFSPLRLSPPFLQQSQQLNIKNTASHLRTCCVRISIFTCSDGCRIYRRRNVILSIWNCINPYFRVSKKAAALSVVLFYHSQSRTSSATTCQFVYAFVPKCFH